MKIVVASDNHGDAEVLKRIVSINNDADLFLHCGDSEMLPFEIAPFISIKGNNDFGVDYPYEMYIDTPIGKIYMCHGNFLYGITPQLVESKNCKIFLFGHIHRKRLQKMKDTYVVCPGSTSFPRGEDPTYLVIEIIENKEPNFYFKNI